MTLRRVTQQ